MENNTKRMLEEALEYNRGLKNNISKLIASLNKELDDPKSIFSQNYENHKARYEQIGEHGREVISRIDSLEKQITALSKEMED